MAVARPPAGKSPFKFDDVYLGDEDEEDDVEPTKASPKPPAVSLAAIRTTTTTTSTAPAKIAKHDSDDDDDDGLLDDFEVIEDSPETTPSVAPTWQEQLHQLQEAYKNMEVEQHAQYLAENAQYLAENAQYYLSGTATAVKSAYTFVRNPLSNNYTPLEQTQMRAIHGIYRNAISEELPYELKIDAEYLRPANKVAVEDLGKSSWLRTLGDGHMAPLAEDLITGICAYQEERYHRKYWQGYLDDPTNLFLDELKRWLVSFLSKTPLDENALKKIQRRVHYLTDILAADIFQPGSASQTTMKMVLVNTRKGLEEQALPVVRQELLNSSARDHIDALIKHTRLTLHHTVLYLFYVLRSSPEVPNNCTLDSIRTPATKPLQIALATGSGVTLRALVTSEPFAAIFPQQTAQPPSEVGGKDLVPFPTAGDVALKNAFISKQGEAIIPDVIGTVTCEHFVWFSFFFFLLTSALFSVLVSKLTGGYEGKQRDSGLFSPKVCCGHVCEAARAGPGAGLLPRPLHAGQDPLRGRRGAARLRPG